VLDVTRAEADADSIARQLDGVTGVWFPGGDQVRLAGVLRGTALLRAIRERFRAGAVVGGTSAGAAIMSDSMITGNQSRPGEDTVGYFGDEFPAIARRTIEVAPGFGFLHGAMVDQHFVRRERHNRLLSVVLERPSLLGVGIDEGTAIEVGSVGAWRILGDGVVVIYDARSAQITAPGAARLGAAGVRLLVLPAGSVFDPRDGRATLAN
jgi:cyanophycinase